MLSTAFLMYQVHILATFRGCTPTLLQASHLEGLEVSVRPPTLHLEGLEVCRQSQSSNLEGLEVTSVHGSPRPLHTHSLAFSFTCVEPV